MNYDRLSKHSECSPGELQKIMKKILTFTLVLLAFALTACAQINSNENEKMIIRISEIEVYPEYLDEYLTFARDVGATSVQTEPGVICIYPMQVKRDKSQIRILEIYASQEAYKSHIASAHFQKYKTSTLKMVKSLDLVDTEALDPNNMDKIFKKLK